MLGRHGRTQPSVPSMECAVSESIGPFIPLVFVALQFSARGR